MIHRDKKIILPKTLELLRKIQKDPKFENFFLVGGTALALQIGHRHSIDLDFFSISPFENYQLEEYLSKKYSFYTDYVSVNTLKGFVERIKVDFLTHSYDLVRPLVNEDNLSLASTEDIAAMKLNAIAHSGNRQKDFYDLYFLLEHHSLQTMLEAYKMKYPSSNPIIPLKGICWFEDIDFELEKPMLVREITFEAVKMRLLEATNYPLRIF
ncbi:MAG: nucleotidyl transferase AbiEii/AbiGii toxin family protein [Bacteroidetes bacterium]|nr:nucleotidyl transferase AbiEii/AbiGii toxin family protein [Bacteroidota bacterium]